MQEQKRHPSSGGQQKHHQEKSWHEQDDLARVYRNDVHTFLSWESAGRPFKQRSRQFFINAFLIMMAIEIILFLFSQYLLMMVVFSFVFLTFALSSVPPRHFQYKISSQGVLIDKSFFIWDELYDFYFLKHHGEDTLHITTKAYFPGELTLTLGETSTDEVKKVLLHYLPYREYVEPTWVEKTGDWLENNFPLERTTR